MAAPAYYDLPSIKLTQDAHVVYLTSISPTLLKRWSRHGVLIVERFQGSYSGKGSGYQRGISEPRTRDISKFVRGLFPTRNTILPLLPQTVLLNARPGSGRPVFTPARRGSDVGTLRILDRTRLAQVDGQHRIAGVIDAADAEGANWEFELPVAIVDGLSLSQEAAQFLTINTKQTKVKMDLELRVIASRSQAEADRLAKALGFEEWRLKALNIAIALDERPSPWQNSISGPDDSGSEVISERTFVESLSLVCQQSRSLARLNPPDVVRFLAEYWELIGLTYPRAWGQNWKQYILRKTTGVYALNHLAPFAYDICHIRHGVTTRKSLESVLTDLLTDKEAAWRARTGRYASFGTSAAAWGRIANEMGSRLVPGFRLSNQSLASLERKAVTPALDRCVRQAAALYAPLGLREFNRDNVRIAATQGSGGVYVLLSLDRRNGRPKRVYVGKSDAGLDRRLWDHRNDSTAWDLFSAQASSRPRVISSLEGALFHLTPSALPTNNLVHPVNCPYH